VVALALASALALALAWYEPAQQSVPAGRVSVAGLSSM